MPPARLRSASPARSGSRSYFGIVVTALCVAALAGLAVWNVPGGAGQRPAVSKLQLSDIPFDGQRAYAHLKALCALGPRPSGSEGMRRQQAYLQAHFEQLGGRVQFQRFTARHPLSGQPVEMANLIVEWHPDRKERILLCTHYDTRPLPDQDPVDPQGIFLGANDGASGTALLCELGQAMPALQGRYGVDFVFFDGEELVYDGARDPYFLGSQHFAREYVAQPPAHRYVWGVLLDMVGDAQLQIYREVNSLRTPAQRELVRQIWQVAQELGVREFIPATRHEVRDDHLPLNEIARIPTIDIIDFDYPTLRGPSYWHTTQDVPEKCSPLSLAKVGWVLQRWLEQLR